MIKVSRVHVSVQQPSGIPGCSRHFRANMILQTGRQLRLIWASTLMSYPFLYRNVVAALLMMTEIYHSARVQPRDIRIGEMKKRLHSFPCGLMIQFWNAFLLWGRNKPFWENISMEMRKLSYNRTAEMCKNKMDNLKTVYKKIKDTTNETGKKHMSF